tara:strand:- start:321 stop:692 length:372 start_codon:yes stop_codon:yes gene_type:complete
VLPKCNTEAMNLHLKEISVAVAPEAHAILIVDQAGWHFSKALESPDNITLLALPSKSPELNPVENIWQFMRGELALKPDIQILQRHCRSLLLRLEPTYQSALENHVNRVTRLGLSMIIFAGWY